MEGIFRRKHISPPFTSEQSIIGHGIYLAAIACILFFAPGVLRIFFPFPVELDWWNRLLALPVFNLGILCIGSARAKSRPLIKLTAATRLLVMAALTMLVALRVAPPIALAIGVVDLASAAMTGWALAAEARSQSGEAQQAHHD
jgi:hypothetical protein